MGNTKVAQEFMKLKSNIKDHVIMRALTIIYLTVCFHLPVWKGGYKNGKYRFLSDMPKWMVWTIRLRNEFERKNNLANCFYWFRCGRFYIRKDHSFPTEKFNPSRNHLFCWETL